MLSLFLNMDSLSAFLMPPAVEVMTQRAPSLVETVLFRNVFGF
jgi:hypothetical protein